MTRWSETRICHTLQDTILYNTLKDTCSRIEWGQKVKSWITSLKDVVHCHGRGSKTALPLSGMGMGMLCTLNIQSKIICIAPQNIRPTHDSLVTWVPISRSFLLLGTIRSSCPGQTVQFTT